MSTKHAMSPDEFGALIKVKRQEKGMTLEQLARAIGVTKGAVSNWENGEAQRIQTAHIMGLARVLGLDGLPMIEEMAKFFGRDAVRGTADDIPPHRLDLIRMYGRLPKEVRTPIRLLIQSLAALHHDGRTAHEKIMETKSAEIRKSVASKDKSKVRSDSTRRT